MLQQSPVVTVLMATYNGESYIAEQIDSIISQDYPNIEIMISDDQSSDQTVSILRQYESRYKNIRVSVNETRIGYVKNFELLLQNASGHYFAFADQDDIWLPEKISVMMSAMLKREAEIPGKAVMVHTDSAMISDEGKILFPSYARYRSYFFSHQKDIPTMISKCGVMGNTILINVNLRKIVLPFHLDVVHHDYWITVINELLGSRVSIDKPLVHYRIHDTNTSGKLHLLKKKKALKSMRLLPYHDNNRYEVLKGILTRFKILEEDKRQILLFLNYLRAQKGWIKHYPIMVKEGFFKSNLRSHSKMLGRLALASLKPKTTAKAKLV